MTCEAALERMLEAEPAELRGEADTDLGRHIASCARCTAVAAAMLDELDAVDDAMADYAENAAGRADATAAADAAADAALAAIAVAGRPEKRETRRARRWRRAAWVPLAAAAALAAVLVFTRDDPFPAGPALAAPEPTIEPRVAVTPPPDKGAAIMETENPNITIVWLYEREES